MNKMGVPLPGGLAPHAGCKYFEGASDSRHPGPGAREGGSAREKMTQVFRRRLSRALSVRFARNGGHGSIEEREILTLSYIAERLGVISGCAFLHCKKGTKADLNMVRQEGCRFRRPEDVRADDDTSHVAQAGSTARLGGRQNRIQPLLGRFRQITGAPE